ncbi:MAG: hypothetical protein IKZ04_05435, partial [Spirochaetaceae bacterium]|nr:hypothetical protein [Spirochaetaceae bacterium]
MPLLIHIMVCLGYYNFDFSLSLATLISCFSICFILHLLNKFLPESRVTKYIAIVLLQLPI